MHAVFMSEGNTWQRHLLPQLLAMRWFWVSISISNVTKPCNSYTLIIRIVMRQAFLGFYYTLIPELSLISATLQKFSLAHC